MIIHDTNNYNGPELESYICSGSNGDVYNSKNINRVIKITGYTKTKLKALEFVASNKCNSISNIYSFGRCNDFLWYEIEKLNQITSQVECFIIDFCIWLSITHGLNIENKINELYSNSFYGLKVYKNIRFIDKNKIKEYLPSIILLLDDLNKYKMIHNDLDSGNIMKIDSQYKVIDQESFRKRNVK